MSEERRQPIAVSALFLLYSRWESNPNLRFRKPPFYPLNYRSIKKPAGPIANGCVTSQSAIS